MELKMSKLHVEVCEVANVEKHPNADKLDLIKIKDWQCIVGRDNFKVGDLVIFCPIDSIIPSNLIEEYKLEYLKKDGRVKTVKLRQVLSQGLVLNIPTGKDWKVGKDVAKELGITKYEEPEADYQVNKLKDVVNLSKLYQDYKAKKITLRRFMFKALAMLRDYFLIRTGLKRKKKGNPFFDIYTDMENIKNYPSVFKDGEIVVISEKLHGTNSRFGLLPSNKQWFEFWKKDYEFCYGSHRVHIQNDKQVWFDTNVYGQMVKKYNLDKVLPKDYIFYAEIFGLKIQDLTYGLNGIDMRIFDVKDIKTGQYLSSEEFDHICSELQLPTIKRYYEPYSKEIIEKYTTMPSEYTNKHIREGIVIKPYKERYDNSCGRVILKSINPEYLLRKQPTEFH
jgi:tRNA-binding EMAP/Myf-like protein